MATQPAVFRRTPKATDEPVVDPTINDDLIGTKADDDEPAEFVESLSLMAASWINVHHGPYNISNRRGAYRHIALHYVGSGTSKAGSALANCKYFAGANRGASAHYFVDDSGVWEYADPDQYYTWHIGDGNGRYGYNNYDTIGIEVCINGDQPYTEAEIAYTARLVNELMAKYNIPASRVIRHYDASRKQCPEYYAGTGVRQQRWEALKERLLGDNVTPEDMNKIANMAAESVVNYVLNGVKLRDRIIGTDMMANEAAERLRDTSDPTGRGKEFTDHDHIKWIAATQAQQGERLDAIEEKLDKLLGQ